MLASTSLSVFAVLLDATILFVAFPSITADYPSVSPTALSWVLNAYTIVFAALLIPGGRLADRVGRRRTFLWAVVLFTTASMLCGIAPGVGFLVAARVLQAIGAGALVPSSLALVLQTFPREKMPAAVAVWAALGAIAGAAGPTIGALVVENLGWRWAFFINLPVGIVSWFLGRRVLHEGRESNPGRLPDPLTIVLLIAGLALTAFGIVETSRWGWADTRFVTVEVAAGVLLTIFVLRCRAVTNPLLDLALFKSRSFRWANAAMFTFSVGFNGMFLGNILFLTRAWGYSILRAGAAVAVSPFVVALTAPMFGRIARRIGQRRLLLPGGLVLAAAGVVLLASTTTTPHYATQFLPSAVLAGIAAALCLPQVTSAAVQDLPPDRYGQGGAVGQAVRNLGATLGVAAVIAFTTGATGADVLPAYRRVWWMLVGSGLSITLLAVLLPRRDYLRSGKGAA